MCREHPGFCLLARLQHGVALGESRPCIGVDRVPDRRVHRSRRDERRADAGTRQLGPQHLMHPAQAELAGGVGGRARERYMVGDGADGDEVPGAAPHEVWDQGTRYEKGGHEIHGDGAGELVGRCLRNRLDEEDARVIHDDVRDPPVGEDVADGALHGRGVGHVTAQVHPTVGRAVDEGTGEPHDVRPRAVQQLGHGESDPARGARDAGELPGKGGGRPVAHPGPRLYTSRRNSSRVFASWSSAPRRALVTSLEFCFSTPRIIMQRWYASITTPTPRGSSTSISASATWSVSRSWTCSRRANTSITRGIFERPTKRPFGRYATCARPKNGSRWCSHNK